MKRNWDCVKTSGIGDLLNPCDLGHGELFFWLTAAHVTANSYKLMFPLVDRWKCHLVVSLKFSPWYYLRLTVFLPIFQKTAWKIISWGCTNEQEQNYLVVSYFLFWVFHSEHTGCQTDETNKINKKLSCWLSKAKAFCGL